MLARRDDTEQTHNSPRAIHYNIGNIQKSKGLSNRTAEKNQIKQHAKHPNNRANKLRKTIRSWKQKKTNPRIRIYNNNECAVSQHKQKESKRGREHQT